MNRHVGVGRAILGGAQSPRVPQQRPRQRLRALGRVEVARPPLHAASPPAPSAGGRGRRMEFSRRPTAGEVPPVVAPRADGCAEEEEWGGVQLDRQLVIER
jgi:hypothetical protein